VQHPARDLYLDLMKKCLTRIVFEQSPEFDQARRAVGADWPLEAETMIGQARLESLETCVRDVVERGVPGDLIEAGVWRGGATILMRAVLKAYGDTSRTVWVADSFRGLPPPNAKQYPADEGSDLHEHDYLAVSQAEVARNFERYGLFDEQVQFLAGWFHETLPKAPIEQLAVLRLDGDMYESTSIALEALYPKLSPGGYAIADDYGAIPACQDAVDDYRRAHGITEPLVEIDWTGAYWRRTVAADVLPGED